MKDNVEKKEDRGQVTPTFWLIFILTLLGIIFEIIGLTKYVEELVNWGVFLVHFTTVLLIPLFFQIMDIENIYTKKTRIFLASILIVLLGGSHVLNTFPEMMEYSFNDFPFAYSFVMALFFMIFFTITFSVWFSNDNKNEEYEHMQQSLKEEKEKNQKLNDEKKKLEDRLTKELKSNYQPVIKCGKLEIAIKKMER